MHPRDIETDSVTNVPPTVRGDARTQARAAISIPSNIAEGAARSSANELRHFLSIARSSLSELDTQYDLSQQLGFVTAKVRSEVDSILDRIDKMLYALRRSLKKP